MASFGAINVTSDADGYVAGSYAKKKTRLQKGI